MNVEEIKKKNKQIYEFLNAYLEKIPDCNDPFYHHIDVSIRLLIDQILNLLVLKNLHEENIELKKMVSQVLERKD